MDVVVPFDALEPKTRLAPVLDARERDAFARAMLRDVLDALDPLDVGVLDAGPADDVPDDVPDAESTDPDRPTTADRAPTVLANAPVEVDAPVIVDERPLTDAVNGVLADRLRGREGDGDRGVADGPDGPDRGGTAGPDGPDRRTFAPVAIVMADLALATPAALERLFDPGADIVVAPGRGGGTNALVVRHPDFRVDYHGASYRDHRENAAAVGASVAVVDSFRLASDVDEPPDLAEVLLHAPADGESRAWLRNEGFDLEIHDGRVGVDRNE